MATSKKTMEVIAKGIEREETSRTKSGICSIRIPISLLTYMIGDLGTRQNDSVEDDTEKSCMLTDAESFISEVTEFFAELATDRFIRMVDKRNIRDIGRMIEILDVSAAEDPSGKTAAEMLQAMFYAEGCPVAAEDLKVLDICAEYDENAYLHFATAFLGSEEICWMRSEGMEWKGKGIPLFS